MTFVSQQNLVFQSFLQLVLCLYLKFIKRLIYKKLLLKEQNICLIIINYLKLIELKQLK